MSRFDPGAGWREVPVPPPIGDRPAELVEYGDDGMSLRGWVREVPLPLPTEEGTVIGIGDWRLVRLAPYEPGLPGTWEMLPIPRAVQASIEAAGARMQCAYSDEWVRAEVEQQGGFEVLAEPRAVTAKAVLDRIASQPWTREVDLTRWRREFGVSA